MRKLQKEPSDSLRQTIRAAGQRATYPFRQRTLKKLDEDVDEFCDDVSMALQALQLKEHQNTRRRTIQIDWRRSSDSSKIIEGLLCYRVNRVGGGYGS
jgi:hypothetical protein